METNLQKLEAAKNAYKEILSLVEKHEDIVLFSDLYLESRVENHLNGLELKYKYNLDIPQNTCISADWSNLNEYIFVGNFGGKTNRKIAWPDDGKQFEEFERLMLISFPCGAYIFGDYFNNNYPVETFNQFFEELKSYGPKYIDSQNSNLYFTLDNAAPVFNNFKSIFEKYQKEAAEENKKKIIKEMEEKIAKLKGNS